MHALWEYNVGMNEVRQKYYPRYVAWVQGALYIAAGICIAAIALFGSEDPQTPAGRILSLLVAAGLSGYGIRRMVRWREPRPAPADPGMDRMPV
jgi:hypothetical protein